MAGAFGVVPSTRVLDTRSGIGAAKAPLPAGATRAVKVTGVGGVPAAGVSAVLVNVVAVSATKPGYLTGWASGTTRPRTSIINFPAIRAIANEVVLPVGGDGKIAFYNGAPGAVQVVADLAGYYRSGTPSAAGTFGVLRSARVLDTRSGIGAAKAPLPAGATRAVKVTGVGGVPAAGVSAVLVNVVAVSAAKPGYLTGWANESEQPGTSIINFGVGQAIANEVVLRVGVDGKIALYNGSAGTVQVVADVAGYYRSGAPSAAGAFGSLPSTRVLDTRSGTGAAEAPLASGATLAVKVAGVGGVPPGGVSAVLVNIITVSATQPGYLTGWASATTRPRTSIINFGAGQAIANEVVLPVGADGSIALYNGSAGTVQVVADLTAYYRSEAPLPWTEQQVAHVQGEPVVSCAAVNFCMAADLYGNAFSWNGSTWSTPQHIGDGADVIDCPTTTFCVAVNADGHIETFRSGSWGHTQLETALGVEMSLSCASQTFCVLMRGGGSLVVFNGASWTEQLTNLSYALQSVSCPTTTLCVAVGPDGVAAHSADGATWTRYGQIGSGAVDLHSVSCVSAQFCVAGAGNGQVTTFNGTTWSDPQTIVEAGAPDVPLDPIICVSTAFCLAFGDSSTYVYDGNSWSGPSALAAEGAVVASCGSPTFCTAFADDGDNYRFNGTTWSGPTPVLPYQGILWSVSCPSINFCMTADGSNTYTFDGSAWSAPMQVTHNVDPFFGPGLVSCTSASFCLAVPIHASGSWTWDGARWTAHADPARNHFTGLSCVSPSFCLGVTHDNLAYTFNGTGWSAGRSVAGSDTLTSVSCATTSFCVATDYSKAFVFNGTAWSGATRVSDETLSTVSCPSPTFCMALDGLEVSHTYDGTAWSSRQLPTWGWDVVSCSSSAFCAAFGENGVTTFDGTAWGPASPLGDPSARGAISCPAIRTCVVVDQEGRAFSTSVS
ncbi:hypothetical protein [Jatrophihabitans sp.]|uniref:hypothetical protein n=1 Tax=Jatrophihabitans sp. TaxID=1932789 RepID=UPI002F0987BC